MNNINDIIEWDGNREITNEIGSYETLNSSIAVANICQHEAYGKMVENIPKSEKWIWDNISIRESFVRAKADVILGRVKKLKI
ncbi:MAG: hypothetical protein IIB95_12965 [Candidatus Marinimicrobia bacterium]|nr:hypothetical protein [Candidatus Neomarinimicrobiota bacterium]MCH7764627.1 hypothetical protein [Candidatus Neomarinimicrobiota bacterium]